MLVALIVMGAIWFGGGWLGWPRGLRTGIIVLLVAVMILLHLTLPDGNPLRVATGGDVRVWIALAVAGALIAAYVAFLKALRRRVAPPPPPAGQPGALTAGELTRYARHITLREIGGTGQKQLKAARVLVIGAGGLGSPALLYLAAAGVGTIGVIDDDVVEETNLQRQIIHADQRLGMGKVFSAEAAMRALNPHVTVRPYNRRLIEEIAAELFSEYDLILDGSDNFDTRYLANRIAARQGIPLIAGAIAQWEGQVSLWHPHAGGPCFECVFPTRPAPGLVPTCAEAGVAASLPGVIGAIMATEAIKHITGAGETLRGRLMIHDALYAEARVIALKPRADCPACGAAARAGWTDAQPQP